MKIGIQTNIWSQERHEKDLDGMLGEVKAAGYDGIEIGAHRIDLTQPAAFRALLVKHGLQVSALHIHGDLADAVQAGDIARRAEEVSAFARQVGAPFVALSGKPRPDKGAADLAREAQLLNHVGYVCSANGIKLIYHNHYWEIENDLRELRYLIANTDAARVSFLLDVAWVHHGGASPAQVIELFRARIGCFHIKDMRGDKFTDLGRGDVDFAALKPAIVGKYDGWLVHERDEALPNALESARASREFLKTNWNV
ncbi:MAG: sugar phosphate isomerase/epimerase [Chloroflexi bacterium]|nr:sugar phosphate isomerase/epimerase [Chloroflexota bacterium]